MKNILLFVFCAGFSVVFPQSNQELYKIIDAISVERIANDIQTLVNFGTRHTLSDTLSESRGIGAARRWIKKEFEKWAILSHHKIIFLYS